MRGGEGARVTLPWSQRASQAGRANVLGPPWPSQPGPSMQRALGSSRLSSTAGQMLGGQRGSYKAAEARPGLKPGLPAGDLFKGLPVPCPWTRQWLLAGAEGATTTQMLPAFTWALRGAGEGRGQTPHGGGRHRADRLGRRGV